MTDSDDSKLDKNSGRKTRLSNSTANRNLKMDGGTLEMKPVAAMDKGEMLQVISFLEDFTNELADLTDLFVPNPYLSMSLFLMRNHVEGKVITPTSLIGASGVPYATASRRLKEMQDAELIEQRPRTSSGKSFSLHPSGKLMDNWSRFSNRIHRLIGQNFNEINDSSTAKEYFFGGSYMDAKSIPPLQILPEPLRLAGSLRVLVHGDPTFMVMESLKRQFEQAIGTPIHQRAFSIDRLRDEALKNAQRSTSRYDIIAIDLPWIGEFVEKGVLMPLDDIMDTADLDPADFHTAGWKSAHWGGRAYGVPAQTTPELLFYRKDLFADAGLEPPTTTDELLYAARTFHAPTHGRYGVAWNAARGTALGHTFLMVAADFGQPILDLAENAGGFDTDDLHCGKHRPTIDTNQGLLAAEFLLELLRYSPPDILSMSWYERVRPYAAGKVAMAYGYTLLAPYFELDSSSPAYGQTGYLPHPAGLAGHAVAPVGGYVMGIPANLPPERVVAAAEALRVFTSPEAQKMYVQNGSRTNPRYSVGADPEVRRHSTIFEAVDGMSWRDELQFWPRPPIPEISDIITNCGQELHDMLRGIVTPKEALQNAQRRADALFDQSGIS